MVKQDRVAFFNADALRAVVYELFLEVFYGKNNKIINFFNNFLYFA